MTVRLRLTLLYSTLLIAIIVVFGVAVYGILERTLRTQLDDDLQAVLDDTERSIRDNLSAEGEIVIAPLRLNTFQSRDTYVQLWLTENDLLVNLSRSLGTYSEALDPAALSFTSTEDNHSHVTIEGIGLRVITRPLVVEGEHVAYIQVAASLEPVEQATDRLFKIMLSMGLGLTIISGLLGYWMALNTLKPINKINETAQAIVAADDLKRRIPYNGKQDELGALADTINQMLQRLDKLFSTQQRFVSDVSHELRTPITAIQGHVEIMQRFGYDEESMASIARSTARMVQLVEDLMLLANADIGRLVPTIAPVELDTLLLDFYHRAKQISAEQGNKHPTIKLGTITPIVTQADEHLLGLLLKHLVNNAVCYTEAGGSITLSLEQSPDRWAEIHVQDTGIGIAEDQLEQIFDRFYRIDLSRTRPKGGSGLGLSIASWIAKAHHGELLVKSKLGEGSVFTLRLPIDSPDLS